MVIKPFKKQKKAKTNYCEVCLCENGKHICGDCEQEMTAKECKEGAGLCNRCIWLLKQ